MAFQENQRKPEKYCGDTIVKMGGDNFYEKYIYTR